VPVEKVLDAAIEHAASAVLISTIITHGEIHRITCRSSPTWPRRRACATGCCSSAAARR
jgi:hypothetical protein